MANYYSYIYLDPRSPGKYQYEGINICFLFKPIYVGKGTKVRYLTHLSPKCLQKHHPFHRTLNKIIVEGFDPKKYIIITPNMVEIHAFLTETNFIKNIGRKKYLGPLLNLTDGGEGKSGFKLSISTRIKISNAHKVMVHSSESKEKMSNIKKGINHPMYGKKYSLERNQKCSNSRSKNWKIVLPDGNQIIVRNLNKFCLENGINQGNMSSVANGKLKSYKGYFCEKI